MPTPTLADRLAALARPFLTVRFLKFACVGASGVVVNLGLLYLFTHAGVQINLASVLAIEGSILTNFGANHLWTFADRHSPRLPLLPHLARFHVVSLVGAGVQLLTFVALNVFWLVVAFPDKVRWEYLTVAPSFFQRWVIDPFVRPPDVGHWAYLSQLAGIAVAMGWNFLANLKWTWAE